MLVLVKLIYIDLLYSDVDIRPVGWWGAFIASEIRPQIAADQNTLPRSPRRVDPVCWPGFLVAILLHRDRHPKPKFGHSAR